MNDDAIPTEMFFTELLREYLELERARLSGGLSESGYTRLSKLESELNSRIPPTA